MQLKKGGYFIQGFDGCLQNNISKALYKYTIILIYTIQRLNIN